MRAADGDAGAVVGDLFRDDRRRLPLVSLVTAEAQVGGPIAMVQNGDKITLDAEANLITVDVSDAEFEKRRKAWQAPAFKATRGTLYKYIKNVKSASEGCVTDE